MYSVVSLMGPSQVSATTGGKFFILRRGWMRWRCEKNVSFSIARITTEMTNPCCMVFTTNKIKKKKQG
jgi:hypothetical protein